MPFFGRFAKEIEKKKLFDGVRKKNKDGQVQELN